MKKIKSLFKRDYTGTRKAYNEIVEGCEWVVLGEGVATIKWDGTCCLIRDGELYKRYDRKLTKSANRKRRGDRRFLPTVADFKPAPDGWEAAEDAPNIHTGHWPGWLLVDFDNPNNKWHKEAWGVYGAKSLPNGTYELVGEKVQGNPYNDVGHLFYLHGMVALDRDTPPRDFDGLNAWFADHDIEGIVWHHEDGRMVKIKRSDFGYTWGGR